MTFYSRFLQTFFAVVLLIASQLALAGPNDLVDINSATAEDLHNKSPSHSLSRKR